MPSEGIQGTRVTVSISPDRCWTNAVSARANPATAVSSARMRARATLPLGSRNIAAAMFHAALGQQEHCGCTEKRDVDRPSKHIQNTTFNLKPELLHYLDYRAVDRREHQLGINAQHKHQADRRRQSQSFADGQIWERAPFFVEGT